MPFESDHISPAGDAYPLVGGTLEDEELILAVPQYNSHVILISHSLPYSLLVNSLWTAAALCGDLNRTISKELADFSNS
jgi:hypothetical protein